MLQNVSSDGIITHVVKMFHLVSPCFESRKISVVATMDWLEGFKSQNNFTFESVCGKSGGVDQQEVYKDRLNFRLELTAPKNYHCS